MKREYCHLAPAFDQKLHGKKVSFKIRNKKGEIKYQGTGSINMIYGLSAYITIDTINIADYPFNTMCIYAKDVYYGKTNLDIIDGEESI